MKTGTLKELNVKPGDVVAWHKACEGYEWQNDNFSGVCDWVVDDEGNVHSKSIDDGFGADCGHKFTIISRATDTPTLWRDMTPEEKGALLLAEYEGENFCIQYQPDGDTSWGEKHKSEPYHDNCAYRRKPEPKVEVVTMSGHLFNNEWYFETHRKDVRHTHRITFNTIDGKPDPASIKMEGL